MSLATAAVLAGGTTLAAYLNAKFHVSKDVNSLWGIKKGEREYARAVNNGRGNTWFIFTETVKKYPNMVCMWSREGIYTYKEVQDRACQYANFFLSKGVKKGDLVAFYLQNRPEFIIAWLGLWSIGCGPAAINYNLTGDALVHCLKISGAKLVLVDDDAGCRERIDGSRDILAGELGMDLLDMDSAFQSTLSTYSTSFPPKDLAMGMKGEFPSMLLYTSGTTGMPKGCAFTMSRLYTTTFLRRASVGGKDGPDGDRWYSCMPLYHGTAAISLVVCLISGVSIAIGKKFSVSNFWRDIRDSDSTTF
ncbi:Fatty acid transporter, partial [Aspergillus sclerotialis]